MAPLEMIPAGNLLSDIALRYKPNLFIHTCITKGILYHLNPASGIWPDMQGRGYAAVVVYRKYLTTQQILLKGAPGGFAVYGKFSSSKIILTGFNQPIDMINNIVNP